ncbi:hypothetical protein QCB44_05115 [Thiomicrorhabdus sp. zzn3]|uniref:hypothetical protein n=1 Tax=Thiomicrorhabdus sp. zzn3 TaxID=3039775 RepID=UPI00243706CE|nr:hypothetical protein [Thiomicrorhabdus sp. zzn3]MDG6778083.1 hypothetical protein [Thiomicrorhabdus sp. zzn3]
MWTYFFAWFPMVLMAIANGILRQSVLEKRFAPLRAHQISSLTGVFLFYVYTHWLHQSWPIGSIGQAWQIGAMWLVMTLVFEFGFGHWVVKHSWQTLLHDYNLFQGRVWPLVLLAVLLLPYAVYQGL